MKGLLKFMLLVAVLLSVFMATAAYGAYRLFFRDGVVSVQVAEKGRFGERVHVAVPAGIINAVLAIAPLGCVDHSVHDEEALEWLPAVQAVVSELENYDDVVLFEAQNEYESVSIVKHDGRLRVMIESPHETVKVSIPAGTVHADVRAFNRL